MAIRALLLTCLNILTYYKYNVLGTKTIDIHMSNNDSLDEETKRILAEVEPDAQSRSNDSKEPVVKEEKKVEHKNDDYNDYDEDDRDPLKDKTMEDSEW